MKNSAKALMTLMTLLAMTWIFWRGLAYLGWITISPKELHYHAAYGVDIVVGILLLILTYGIAKRKKWAQKLGIAIGGYGIIYYTMLFVMRSWEYIYTLSAEVLPNTISMAVATVISSFLLGFCWSNDTYFKI